MKFYEVVIVGGGASGIGAAITLTRQGIPNIILEARDRLGGRVYSEKIDGMQVDLGASWVHSYSKKNAIAKQVNSLKWKSKPASGHYGVEIRQETKKTPSDKDLEIARCHYQRFFQLAEIQGKKSEKDTSLYEAAKQYYNKQICALPPVRRHLADMFINMTEHYEAASIQELSAQHYDERKDTGCDFSPQGSYYSLLMGIVESGKLDYVLETKVFSIDYTGQDVVLECSNGKYCCKKVIVSLPLGILKENIVAFKPELPEKKKEIIQRLGFGVMNKIIMSFQKPFWKDNPSWIRIACEQRGRYPHMFNLSTPKSNILCCFITDNFAKQISKLSDEQIADDILNLLWKVYSKQTVKLKDIKITRWHQEQFSRGSYTHFRKGSCMEDSLELRKSVGRKLWIVGEHCYGEHIGTAHGAYQTGVWAAEEIIVGLKLMQVMTLKKQKTTPQKRQKNEGIKE